MKGRRTLRLKYIGGRTLDQLDDQTKIHDRTECHKGRELHLGGVGTPHRKMHTGSGDTAHTFLMGGTNGVGEKIY